ncbi:tetratricopeptide repeat protein, partial [bacterium]|nr:tetratricopeptide repeat protein [bacterium]
MLTPCRLLTLCLLLTPALWAGEKADPPPPEARIHYSVGVELRVQGKYEEAIAELKKALALDPDTPAILYELGA